VAKKIVADPKHTTTYESPDGRVVIVRESGAGCVDFLLFLDGKFSRLCANESAALVAAQAWLEEEVRREEYAAALRERGPITHTVSDPLTVQLAQNKLKAERHAFLYAAQTGSEAAWLAMAESGAETLRKAGL
jgi:hypothetical protein